MKTQQTTEVHKAIVNVMSEIGAISKIRKNAQQGYSFRGVDDVLNSLQPLLVKHNLVILPSVLNRNETEKQTRNGGTMLHVVVSMAFDLVSAIDGSEVRCVMAGEAMDSGDKATNKAMSTAYKYFAFQTFCIPTDEVKDTEVDSPEIAATAKPKEQVVNNTTAMKPNPVAAAGDDEKPWLNLTNKNGAPNEKGEAAKKFIMEGGKVSDIAKKYKLSKAVREELTTLESKYSNPLVSEPTPEMVDDLFAGDDELPY